MREVTIGVNDAGQRLDKYMSKRFPSMPQTLLYKYIRKKCVVVNGKKVTGELFLNEGDTIKFYISDEFFGIVKDDSYKNVSPEISVAYEDDNILIADKPSGMLTHSDSNESYNTLINRIKAYLYKKGEFDPESEACFAPALCNRIDRNTSGLVIAAKNAESLREMNAIIKNRELRKIYLAVVHGIPERQSGTLKTFLKKDSARNVVYVATNPLGAKEAVLKYRLVDANRVKLLSLLEVELLTGRTHQIRVQLSDAGYPLLGDGKYSKNRSDKELGFESQALCAYSVEFTLREKHGILSYLDKLKIDAKKPAFLELFY